MVDIFFIFWASAYTTTTMSVKIISVIFRPIIRIKLAIFRINFKHIGRLGMADIRRIYGGHTVDVRRTYGRSTADRRLTYGGYTADIRLTDGWLTADIRLIYGGYTADIRLTYAGNTAENWFQVFRYELVMRPIFTTDMRLTYVEYAADIRPKTDSKNMIIRIS